MEEATACETTETKAQQNEDDQRRSCGSKFLLALCLTVLVCVIHTSSNIKLFEVVFGGLTCVYLGTLYALANVPLNLLLAFIIMFVIGVIGSGCVCLLQILKPRIIISIVVRTSIFSFF